MGGPQKLSAQQRFQILLEFDKHWRERRQPNQTSLVQGYRSTLAPLHDNEAAIRFAKERAKRLKYDFVDKDKGDKGGTGS